MNITKILKIIFLCSIGFHHWAVDRSRHSAIKCKDCGKIVAAELRGTWKD